jgi:hypothetical protein
MALIVTQLTEWALFTVIFEIIFRGLYLIIYLLKKTCPLALKYMGCFADSGSKGKDLNGTIDDNVNSGGTIESCIDKCKQSKYAYAGTQSG